jgi:hypothetical protein
LDSLADLSAVWWFLLLAFLLPLSGSLMLKIGRLLSRLAEMPSVLPLFFAGALGAVFTLSRSKNFLLGDSLLYVHALEEGIQIESAGRREAGATFVVSALNWSLRKTAFADSLTPFIVASVAAGVVYVLLCFAMARLLAAGPAKRGLILGSLLALGALQVFFGHAEYYSLVAATGGLYLYLALRWLKGRGTLLLPSFALALAIFVHVMNALLLLSFVGLLLCAAKRKRYIEAAASAALLPALLVSAAVIIRYPWESFLMIFSRGKHLLPLGDFDPEFYAYGLFSSIHIIEVANVLILAAPCLPLLLLAAVVRRRPAAGTSAESGADQGAVTEAESRGSEALLDGGSRDSRAGAGDSSASDAVRANGEKGTAAEPDSHAAKATEKGGRKEAEAGVFPGSKIFLALAAAGAGLFTFLANPALGMARDWDIFAFPSMILTLAAAAAAAGRLTDRRHILWLCGAVVVTGTLHLSLFAGNNRVKSAYVPRLRRIAEQENLFAPTPRAELWRYLGWEALNMDDTEQAREDLLRSVRDYTSQVKAYKMLAVIDIGEKFNWLASPEGRARRRALELETEEEVTREAARLGLEQYYTWVESEAPNKVRAYLGAGIAAMKVNAADSLIVNAVKRAVETDPEDLEARAFWGDMLRTHGLTDKAEEQYNWVLARQRWHVRAYLGMACVFGVRGEPEMAHVLVKELRDHHTWSVEAQQFLQAWRKGELSEPEDFRTFIIAQ